MLTKYSYFVTKSERLLVGGKGLFESSTDWDEALFELVVSVLIVAGEVAFFDPDRELRGIKAL